MTTTAEISGEEHKTRLDIWVSSKELEHIEKRVKFLGMTNRSAYLRRMVLDGYVVNLDLPQLNTVSELLSRNENRLEELLEMYQKSSGAEKEVLMEASQCQKEIWEVFREILIQLSHIY